MFITPMIVKSDKDFKISGTTDSGVVKTVEAEPKNLKTYVKSNVQKFGHGPDTYVCTTMSSKQELFGAWTQSSSLEKPSKEESSEEQEETEEETKEETEVTE